MSGCALGVKSAPRKEFWASAMTKILLKALRSLRLRAGKCMPYVAIGDPLTAWRVSLVLCFQSVDKGGRTD